MKALNNTQPVPEVQWQVIITYYLGQLGKPTYVAPPNVEPTSEAAETVTWGTGNEAFSCQKVHEELTTDLPGQEIFVSRPTYSETIRAFDILKKSGLKIKDDLRTIQEIGGAVGPLAVTLGSVLLPFRTAAGKEDGNVVGVIHNPNYPGMAKKGGRGCVTEELRRCAQVASYLLAGLVGAAIATRLGRRR